MVDQVIMDGIAAVLVVALPILVAYLKKVLNQKNIGEAQVDQMFDFADAELAGVLELFPNDTNVIQKVGEIRVKLLKLRAFYNDPATTTEEMKALLSAIQSIKFRTLKPAPTA